MGFDELNKMIEDGMEGKNQSIPIGLPRLGKYANIRKNIFTLIFSSTGAGKCLAKGTKVLMYDGSFKEVENVKRGDLVMGVDSTPRIVHETHSGIDEMFKIHQNKGEDYVVNKEHILRLVKRRKKNNEYLEIPVKEALLKTPSFFHEWKGYKSSGIDFPKQTLDIDPYLLGLWLGDGTSCKPQITTMDKEIVDYLNDYVNKNELLLKKPSYNKYCYDLIANKLLKETKDNGEINFYSSLEEASRYIDNPNGAKYISNVVRGLYKKFNDSHWEWVVNENSFLVFLQKNNLLCNKYIPDEFILNSRENRLKLLAGLLDSDGHYQKNKNGFEITLKSKILIDKLAFLSRSLGFYTSINSKMANLKRIGKEDYNCLVYRIFIWGENLGDIPCLLPRKKAINTPNKIINPLNTGISIESIGTGEYYGFSLDGDGLFMLEDLTVVHNSSMLDTMILNACFDYMNHPYEGKLIPDFQLFSMERSKIMRIAKWLSYIVFINEGIEIQLPKMLGWWDDKLTKEEHSLIKKYEDYLNQLLNDFITIHEGAKTPNEIYKIMKDHYEENGEYGDEVIKGKRHRLYLQNDSKKVVIPAFDHGNLTKTTQELSSKKQAIDKLVSMVQGFRDLENSAPIWISQVNRSISGLTRAKDGEYELMLDDTKESGDIADACDLAISLFNPLKFGQSSKTGYNPNDFLDTSNGANYFRSAQILKSSYGADDLRIPLAFNGFAGQFKELPKRKDLNDDQYRNTIQSVLNKSYFLE